MAQAADKLSCDKVLHLCDTALNEQIKENSIQRQIIADQDARYNVLQSELQSDRAWYKNPIVDIFLGVIGGVVLESQVHK